MLVNPPANVFLPMTEPVNKNIFPLAHNKDFTLMQCVSDCIQNRIGRKILDESNCSVARHQSIKQVARPFLC